MDSKEVYNLSEAYKSIYEMAMPPKRPDPKYPRSGIGVPPKPNPEYNRPRPNPKPGPTPDIVGRTPPRPNPKPGPTLGGVIQNSADLFDIIKGHLMSEGYADTEEAALAIMANMSEEWRQSIVEAVDDTHPGHPNYNPNNVADTINNAVNKMVRHATGQRTKTIRANRGGVPGTMLTTQSGPFSTTYNPDASTWVSDAEMNRRNMGK